MQGNETAGQMGKCRMELKSIHRFTHYLRPSRCGAHHAKTSNAQVRVKEDAVRELCWSWSGEWRSAPVETFEFFAFSESRFVYFVRIHDAHAHLDDTKIEACAHTEYVLKSHKMVR